MPARRWDLLAGSSAVIALLAFGMSLRGRSEPRRVKTPWTPRIAAASAEAEAARRALALGAGCRAELFAAEPDLANPVALSVGPRGEVFVAECFRRAEGGIGDNRQNPEWVDDDLASRTLADREAIIDRWHPEYRARWTRASDRVRRLVDRDGDGRADHSGVFAEGFDGLLSGAGAGVLVRGDRVWFTCIPDLWRLQDDDGDGIAEKRESLARGFGVRFAFRGHDLHGLVLGPQGRIWFSVGDRGATLVTKEGRRIDLPDQGAVFRMEPDGSQLEVYAAGLRNPQELAFDERGDLFTVDNNSDGGDRARVVRVLEGGDSGWRMGFNYIADRGPWMREGWCETARADTPAFLVPPIAYLGNGPAGLAIVPEDADLPVPAGSFLLCDFLGSRPRSGVRRFRLEPDGASHRLIDEGFLVKNLLATDVEVAADGAAWVTDWVESWEGSGKGRIYRILAQDTPARSSVQETAALLRSGIAQSGFEERLALLGHRDRRVRQEAQFLLAADPARSSPALRRLVVESRDLPARRHALWALAMIDRRSFSCLEGLDGLLDDPDPELRECALEVLAEGRGAGPTVASFEARLQDPQPRVRAAAARALGRRGGRTSVAALLARLEGADASSPVIRAVIQDALRRLADRDEGALAILAEEAGTPARKLASVVVLRRRHDARVARFLEDADPMVAREAALAIWDEPLPAAFAALAARLDRPEARDEAVLDRAIAAAGEGRSPADAERLARCAADPMRPLRLRVRALLELGAWTDATRRDAVLNRHRPRRPGTAADREAVLPTALDAALESTDPALLAAAVELVGRARFAPVVDRLAALVFRREAPVSPRAAALEVLAQMRVAGLPDLLDRALHSDLAELRAAASRLLAGTDPQAARPILMKALTAGAPAERRLAVEALAGLADPEADRLLAEAFQRASRDWSAAEEGVELVHAAAVRRQAGSSRLAALLDEKEARDAQLLPVDRFAHASRGGDAVRGEAIFRGSAAGCTRCHALDPKAAAQAGPDLSKVGARRDRRRLLESIVDPNAVVEEGYATILVFTRDGESFNGRRIAEDEGHLEIEVNDYGNLRRVSIERSRILEARPGLSAMPTDLGAQLGAAAVRDLVEFLVSRR